MPELTIDADACVHTWGGCDETYHGGHECDRRNGHPGRHRCPCGATTTGGGHD